MWNLGYGGQTLRLDCIFDWLGSMSLTSALLKGQLYNQTDLQIPGNLYENSNGIHFQKLKKKIYSKISRDPK